MGATPCAVESALRDYYRKQESGEELWIASEEELYQRIDPLIEELKSVIRYHASHNDAGMDYSDARNFVIETLGELL